MRALKNMIYASAFICLFSVNLSAIELKVIGHDFVPFTFLDHDGNITGFSVELVEELFKRADVRFERGKVIFMNWTRAYNTLLNEENVLEVIVARKPDREDLFHWVGPIYPREHWVFKLKTRTDIHVQSVDDAKRYTIGALLDTANYALFLEQGFEPGKNLIAIDTSESKLNMFLAGRIDLVSYLPLEAAYRLKLLGKSYELVEPLFLASGDLEYYFGLSKAIPEEIVQTLQYHLNEMKHDGTFEKIKHHYIEE